MAVIKKILGWVFGLATIIIVANLAASNRGVVHLYFWPFTDPLLASPLWLVVIGGFCAGFIIGGIILWFSLLTSRLANHRLRRRVMKLEALQDQRPALTNIRQKADD